MSSNIKIIIPNNNIAERKYIIYTIFNDFLGLSFDIDFSGQSEDYILSFGNKRLIIEDAFWNIYPEPLDYLNDNFLPKVQYSTNQFIVEKDIPVLYGSEAVTVSEDTINCKIDIFASVFFMLTRWEEYVNSIRDAHNRFPGIESSAYKNDFLHRPIVNEYVEMLWNMLVNLGYEGKRKNRKFELILTHDVDILKTEKKLNLRAIVGDLLKRKDFRSAYYRMLAIVKDPLNTFTFLMDVSESIGVKSHFYFMSVSDRIGINEMKNYLNSKKFYHLVKEIKLRGHIIGFHPGYFSYNDENQWQKEKQILEKALGFPVFEGRQHYLMMDVSKTLPIWDNQGMEKDSTLSYADREGFRCGTGDCFQVFNFLSRNKLSLVEMPLIVMEGSLKTYQNATADKAKEILNYYIGVGKKYKMCTTFLFHNSSFNNHTWKGWKKIYNNVFTNI